MKPKKSSPKVAIIILTYSQGKLLGTCLESLKKFTKYKNYEVFVIDNNSQDKIGKRIKEKFPKINVKINDKNYGFSKGNNIGIDLAREKYNPDYFLILNDDTEFFQSNWLGGIINLAEKNKEVGVIGCKLVYPDKRMQNAGGYLKGLNITKIMEIGKKDFLDVDHVMGAFMFVRRETMDELGGFDEDFSPYLLEDTDFCLRAKKLNFKIKSFGGVEVIHKAHQSMNKTKDPKLFFRFKNDILFLVRHLGFFNALFRIFVYLPGVAILEKENDEVKISPRYLRIRRDFLFNIWCLAKAYLFVVFGGRGIQNE